MCILKLRGGGRNCPVVVSYSVFFIKILFQGISDAAGIIFKECFTLKCALLVAWGPLFCFSQCQREFGRYRVGKQSEQNQM